ncbi:MAG: hypothetical protein ACYDG6_10575 [Thermincolia bacterium]
MGEFTANIEVISGGKATNVVTKYVEIQGDLCNVAHLVLSIINTAAKQQEF